MAQLTFVTVCMGRLAFLKETLPHMVGQADCDVVVVDYSCPEKAGDWVAATFPQVRILRIPGETTINVTRARNAGAALVQAPWICFIDSDIVLDPRFASTVLPQVKPGNFYRPHPESSGIIGTFIVSREDFQKAGGYDEVFRTYGDDDYDVYDNLRFHGLTQARYPAALVRHLPHTHEMRSEKFDFKERVKGVLVNRCYRIVKWELARARGTPLTPDERRALYTEIFDAALQALVYDPVYKGYPMPPMVAFMTRQIEQRAGIRPGPKDMERINTAILKP